MQWGNERQIRLVRRRRKKRANRIEVLARKYAAIAFQASNPTRVEAAQKFLLIAEPARSDVIAFLKTMRALALNGVNQITIDFRKTNKVEAGGMLLVYAEIHRLKRLCPNIKFKCIPSRNNQVNQVLQHLEVFSALNHSSKVKPKRYDVVSWRHASAESTDCSGAGKVIEAYESLSNVKVKLLFKACSEAITNVVMHAYCELRGDGLDEELAESRWWMFCREDVDNLMIVVCDLGIGIPRSLPVKHGGEVLGKILGAITFGAIANDAEMIEAGLEYSRTRTRLKQQGKGLSDLRRIVDGTPRSKLWLISNQGMVTIAAGEEPVRRNFSSTILGTVVAWRLPLESIGSD